ncbi:unnamed protein product, partial [Brassicogethes aeneus]
FQLVVLRARGPRPPVGRIFRRVALLVQGLQLRGRGGGPDKRLLFRRRPEHLLRAQKRRQNFRHRPTGTGIHRIHHQPPRLLHRGQPGSTRHRRHRKLEKHHRVGVPERRQLPAPVQVVWAQGRHHHPGVLAGRVQVVQRRAQRQRAHLLGPASKAVLIEHLNTEENIRLNVRH